MIEIDLDPAHEQQLRELAASRREDVNQLAQKLIEEYLDCSGWEIDTDQQWGEASVELVSEIINDEPWDHDDVVP